jgi:hypothetical protein
MNFHIDPTDFLLGLFIGAFIGSMMTYAINYIAEHTSN